MKPCKRGHVDRYPTGACRACVHLQRDAINSRRRANYAEDSSTRREENQRWKNKSRGKISSAERARYKRGADRIKNITREYRQSNPLKVRAYSKARRRRVNAARPRWMSVRTLTEFYMACPIGLSVDHLIPISHPDVCGLHVPWNLRYVTFEINKRKRNHFDPKDWSFDPSRERIEPTRQFEERDWS